MTTALAPGSRRSRPTEKTTGAERHINIVEGRLLAPAASVFFCGEHQHDNSHAMVAGDDESLSRISGQNAGRGCVTVELDQLSLDASADEPCPPRTCS
ncbi:MAG: hypothetical protein B6A08_20775 [Sorangiineae bacterium NIC37A_2]|nr:MAG: hypothetical protein B6A08_20775 [Sorangiineae bacterium NIC37A_2]